MKKGGFLMVNVLAMLTIFVLLCIGAYLSMSIYTRHGEAIEVPNVKGMNIDKAKAMFEELGLEVVVSDSGYIKRLPAGQILEQSPKSGLLVKSGHIIYLTVNSGVAESAQIPDLIDNSSYREAEAELLALGFKVYDPIRVHGEKDWVYGILSNGRNIYTGDFVAIDSKIQLQVGDGKLNESLDKVEVEDASEDEEDEFDEFEVVN
ncbi:MAG: PASTA domain-containing protein [Bacteroidaceae bacterium]|nr:PASTA domain-containing protein [Bacteroidaceae bacterium]